MSAKKSLERYYQRQLNEQERSHRPKRKNAKPEFEVKKAVMVWLKENHFSCDAVESKAVYSARAGRYLNSQATPGFADIAGACPNGLGCFIELKAPGKRSTLRHTQRDFLMGKINLGCFAVCVDSVSCLQLIWNEFGELRVSDTESAKNLLRCHLPPEKDLHFSLD